MVKCRLVRLLALTVLTLCSLLLISKYTSLLYPPSSLLKHHPSLLTTRSSLPLLHSLLFSPDRSLRFHQNDVTHDVSSTSRIRVSLSRQLPRCPKVPPHLEGYRKALEVDKPLTMLEREWGHLVHRGDYRPPHCTPEHRTAILIPCRNRWAHLRVLLNHLIPFLVRQQVSFTLFIIEADQHSHFNKGILLNAGYIEAMHRDNYSCIIVQDVDLLPLNDQNLYRCGDQPRHLAVGIDKFHFKLPYRDYFGGALALTSEQVEKVNGHSNVYFGWGGEDDDIYIRLRAKGYTIQRMPVNMAQYHMIHHHRDAGNEETMQKFRLVAREEVERRMDVEGLRQVVYHRDWVVDTPLYIWVRVTVNETQVIQNFPDYVREKFRDGLKFLHRTDGVTPL